MDFYHPLKSKYPEKPYQLHMICDGHGPSGHLISAFIIENYPSILRRLILIALKEYEIFEKTGSRDVSPNPRIVVEGEETEETKKIVGDSEETNIIYNPLRNRWELRK